MVEAAIEQGPSAGRDTPTGRRAPVGPLADLFVLGHSHIGALAEAMQHHGVDIRRKNLWLFGPPVHYDTGQGRLDAELDAMLGPIVISTVGGSAYDMLGLARHPRPFDFVLSSAPDMPLDADAELVPVGAVAAALMAQIEDNIIDLVPLLAASGRRVVHLEPPPPVGEDARLAHDMAFMAFVPDPNLGPGPAWLRLKLWRLHSDLIRARYEPVGVEVWPCPAECQDPQGFLKPELYAYPGHANAGYGALVLRQLGLAA